MERRAALVVMVVALLLAAGIAFLAFTADRPLMFIPAAVLLGIGLWSTTQMRTNVGEASKERDP